MPASEVPEGATGDGHEAGDAQLERLEEAMDELLEQFAAARAQAARAESESDELRQALSEAGRTPATTRELEERVEALSEENERLREVLARARERAERIRSRLMVVEDEI